MVKSNGQLYKIRKGPHGENVVHAPIEFNGWVKLSVSEDGKSFLYEAVIV